MLANDKALTEAEDRAISAAAWVLIAVSMVFLMCLIAATGCVSTPDMPRDTAVGIVALDKVLRE
jgi:hypothetical protein